MTTPNDPDVATPDPTIATLGTLETRLSGVRDYVDGKVEVLNERLAGIDEATKLRLTGIVEIPTQIEEKVGHLADLMSERFSSVQQQFVERDTRSERESRDNKVAVDAAFAAQKEAASEQNKSNTLAIGKSEEATKEALNKLSELFTTTVDGLSDKIDDLKERIARVENVKEGVQQQQQSSTQSKSNLYGAIAAVAAIAAIIGLVLGFVVKG